MPSLLAARDQQLGVDVGRVHQVLARHQALAGQGRWIAAVHRASCTVATVVIACVIRWTASSSQVSLRCTRYPTQEVPERVR